MRSRHCVVTVSSLCRHRVILFVVVQCVMAVTLSSSSPCHPYRCHCVILVIAVRSTSSLIASSPRRPPPRASGSSGCVAACRCSATWRGTRPATPAPTSRRARRPSPARCSTTAASRRCCTWRAAGSRARRYAPTSTARARSAYATYWRCAAVSGGGGRVRTSEGRPSRRDTVMLGGQRVLVGVEKYLNLTFGFCFFDAQLFFRKSSWNSVTERCAVNSIKSINLI